MKKNSLRYTTKLSTTYFSYLHVSEVSSSISRGAQVNQLQDLNRIYVIVAYVSSAFPSSKRRQINLSSILLYVQEVVTLQKKIFNIFASENEEYTIY